MTPSLRLAGARPALDRRRPATPLDQPLLSGIECRAEDVERTGGLSFVAILFRVMSGLLLVVMVVQAALGLTSTVEVSYGVLLGEAIRLLIFAGLLWAAGDLARLFVQSHGDLRATRILLARLTAIASRAPTPASSLPAIAPEGRRESEYRE